MEQRKFAAVLRSTSILFTTADVQWMYNVFGLEEQMCNYFYRKRGLRVRWIWRSVQALEPLKIVLEWLWTPLRTVLPFRMLFHILESVDLQAKPSYKSSAHKYKFHTLSVCSLQCHPWISHLSTQHETASTNTQSHPLVKFFTVPLSLSKCKL